MKSRGRINRRQERSLTVEVTPQEVLTNKKEVFLLGKESRNPPYIMTYIDFVVFLKKRK